MTMSAIPRKIFLTTKDKLLKQAESYLAQLDEVRPFVNEQGRIEEFARLYTAAYMAKLRLTR